MATLTQLTTPQVFALATTSGDSSGQIGSWVVDRLDSYISNLPAANNPCNLAYNEAFDLITDAGLNPSNLSNTELAHANMAMAYSVAYKLIRLDATGAETLPGENFDNVRNNLIKRTYAYFELAGTEYSALGIADDANPYWINEAYTNLAEVTPCMVTR